MKKILLLAGISSLLLSSCNLGQTPDYTLKSLSGTVVEGTFTNNTLTTKAWSQGAGKAALYTNSTSALVTTTLNADGSFSFASLPAPPEADLKTYTPDTSSSCTDNVTLSDKTVKLGEAMLGVTVTGATTKIPALPAAVSADGKTRSYWILAYADKDVTMSGTRVCTYSTAVTRRSETYDLKLKTGWNVLKTTITTSGTETSTTYTQDKLPSQWVADVNP